MRNSAWKKTVSILLSATCALGLVTGCGQTEAQGEKEASAQEVVEETFDNIPLTSSEDVSVSFKMFPFMTHQLWNTMEPIIFSVLIWRVPKQLI